MADPENLREAYLRSIYHAAGAAFTLAGEATGERLYGGRRFGFLTAWNPHSRKRSRAENELLNASLAARLLEAGLAFDASYGTSRDASWREDGFIVWDADAVTMLELGREFEQNAVLWGEGGRVALGWCPSGELEWYWPKLEPRASRVAPPAEIE